MKTSFSSSHTALQLNWTGSLWSCSFLPQPKDTAGLTMPSSTVNGERLSSNSWKCFFVFFFFYRHEEQTGHQSSAVHPMSCVTWRRTLLMLEEHSCSGRTHLHVLVISITKPFTLKISFAYSIGGDTCLSSNWALGSTITLRKQREAHQQGKCFPFLWPEKQ